MSCAVTYTPAPITICFTLSSADLQTLVAICCVHCYVVDNCQSFQVYCIMHAYHIDSYEAQLSLARSAPLLQALQATRAV
jgi:hypothetical protein